MSISIFMEINIHRQRGFQHNRKSIQASILLKIDFRPSPRLHQILHQIQIWCFFAPMEYQILHHYSSWIVSHQIWCNTIYHTKFDLLLFYLFFIFWTFNLSYIVYIINFYIMIILIIILYPIFWYINFCIYYIYIKL